MNNSIDALLEAAEFLERRERDFVTEVEHGYASSYPGSSSLLDEIFTQTSNHPSSPDLISGGMNRRLTTNMKSASNNSLNRKPQGNRSTHNELEKNRRAHLRNCLEKLKDIVPVGGDSSRHTTLGLLNKAKHFIKTLEEKERKTSSHRENLQRDQRYLRRRLELLSTQVDAIHKRRSVSECSTSTVSSSQSSHSESDEHEVDVIGYGGASDDDHSSIRSGTSDGGVTVTTWRQLSIGGEA
jgi:MAX dimerization protein